MSYENEVLKLQRLDHTFDIVGLNEEAVVLGMAVGFTPAAQVHGDATEGFGERRDDRRPRAPRASPVVDKHKRRGAFTLFFGVNLQLRDADSVSLSTHGWHP